MAKGPDGANSSTAEQDEQFTVALSFAGAQRSYVERVAARLKEHGVAYFYDADSEIELWGKDLLEEFQRIYMTASHFVVMFISAEYVKRDWTRHERQSALNRALRERRTYVLPVRFDDTPVPGLSTSLAYLSLSDLPPEALADRIISKIVSEGGAVPARAYVGNQSKILARSIDISANTFVVSVRDANGTPLADVALLAVSRGGIATGARTDTDGRAAFVVPIRRQVTVLAALESHHGVSVADHDTAHDLAITLPASDEFSSTIFEKGTGYLPGLVGRLNPILDGDRQYLYADNIAIDDEPQQPRAFHLGEELVLEDVNGTQLLVSFIDLVGRSSLIRYRDFTR